MIYETPGAEPRKWDNFEVRRMAMRLPEGVRQKTDRSEKWLLARISTGVNP
jgi:hypothetical protein